jgi:YfiH family protein
MSTHELIADWPAPRHVHCKTVTRVGGASRPPFRGLNCAAHVGDDPQHVAHNRNLLITKQLVPSKPCWLNQQHTNTVVRDPSSSTPVVADASLTEQKNRVLAIMTADCVPIMLCHTQYPWVGAIHAGWRGLTQNIVEAVLSHCPEPKHCMAWLGPAIGVGQYPIGATHLAALSPEAQSASVKYIRGKPHLDLYDLSRFYLQRSGVHAIYGGQHCTYQRSDWFYSFRRSNTTGRHSTFIWLT